MTLAQCHPSFQQRLKDLAEKYGKDAETIYGWWRKYSETCRNYDQSPVLFEFENWYKADLEK